MNISWRLLFLYILALPVMASNMVMPKDLVDFAGQNSCSQIDDFYERSGIVNPPYVYGYLSGEPDKSAILWCKKTITDEKPYVLLIKIDAKSQSLECPDRIDWWNFPGGLSIDSTLKLALSDFHKVTDVKQKGPDGMITKGNSIISYYDGVSTIFYCYKGEWLYRIRD